MPRKIPAKRANKPNPRTERNKLQANIDNIIDFSDFEVKPKAIRTRRQSVSDNIQPLPFIPKRKLDIIPRNIAQEDYLDALENENNTIVIAIGPAGTGKSLLCTQFAIKGFLDGRFDKIIITRPTVSTGEDIGFLPGTLLEKLTPWCIPILDIFKEVFSVATLQKMIKDEVLELAPLGMCRGRTFKNSIVICDEIQNALPSQVKMLLTRIGDNSRMVLTGDLFQHDRGFEENGLKDFVSRLKNHGESNAITICEFTDADVERHPIIQEVLNIYRD